MLRSTILTVCSMTFSVMGLATDSAQAGCDVHRLAVRSEHIAFQLKGAVQEHYYHAPDFGCVMQETLRLCGHVSEIRSLIEGGAPACNIERLVSYSEQLAERLEDRFEDADRRYVPRHCQRILVGLADDLEDTLDDLGDELDDYHPGHRGGFRGPGLSVPPHRPHVTPGPTPVPAPPYGIGAGRGRFGDEQVRHVVRRAVVRRIADRDGYGFPGGHRDPRFDRCGR